MRPKSKATLSDALVDMGRYTSADALADRHAVDESFARRRRLIQAGERFDRGEITYRHYADYYVKGKR